ncbi:MAG: BON domain-containing protein [Bdellovibrionaceae bacterium]|nr:BON domain-containing protein [Pseudobdellovibrionaceae bacterium]
MKSITSRYILAAALGIGGGVAMSATAETAERANGTENALNAVERNRRLPSAEQQGLSAREAETTRRIREAIMNDPSLSMSAKNVTVVTRGETVTLRGRLVSEAERTRVEQIAKQKSGNHNVVNATSIR